MLRHLIVSKQSVLIYWRLKLIRYVLTYLMSYELFGDWSIWLSWNESIHSSANNVMFIEFWWGKWIVTPYLCPEISSKFEVYAHVMVAVIESIKISVSSYNPHQAVVLIDLNAIVISFSKKYWLKLCQLYVNSTWYLLTMRANPTNRIWSEQPFVN